MKPHYPIIFKIMVLKDNNVFEEFGKLRVGQIKKSDKKYKSVLKDRLKRLRNWKSQIPNTPLSLKLEQHILLTKECDHLADTLKWENIRLIGAFPTNEKQFFKRVGKHLSSAPPEDPMLKEFLKEEVMK
jgi:hypothetical protein